MAFVSVEDKYGKSEVILFPQTMLEYGNMLVEGIIVYIIGNIQRKMMKTSKLYVIKFQKYQRGKMKLIQIKISQIQKTMI